MGLFGTTTTAFPKSLLLGRRILVVEDEMVSAMLLTTILEDLGCTVIKARHLQEAVEMASTQALDGACLDVNVAGKPVYPVADELRRRHIPFMFVTGHFAVGLRAEYHDCIIIKKPFNDEDIARGVKAFMAESCSVKEGKKKPSLPQS